MNDRSQWALIACWTAAASAGTLLLWIPLAAIAGSFESQLGAASLMGAMFVYVFYLSFFGPLITLALAPAYLALFWLWGRVCLRHPWVDRRWTPILTAALVVSVLPGAVIPIVCDRAASGIDYGHLLAWVPCCVGVFFGAIVLPRWLFDELRPGAFPERPSS